jgi:L-aspartate oxidase
VMSRYAAIGRDEAGLATASAAITGLTTRRVPTGRDGYETAALTLAARLILAMAAARTESRGCHVRADHLGPDDQRWRHSLAIDATGTITEQPHEEVAV